MFYSLQELMENIYHGESSLSWEDFEERVQAAWADDKITGTQYDWLIGNSGSIGL